MQDVREYQRTIQPVQAAQSRTICERSLAPAPIVMPTQVGVGSPIPLPPELAQLDHTRRHLTHTHVNAKGIGDLISGLVAYNAIEPSFIPAILQGLSVEDFSSKQLQPMLSFVQTRFDEEPDLPKLLQAVCHFAAKNVLNDLHNQCQSLYDALEAGGFKTECHPMFDISFHGADQFNHLIELNIESATIVPVFETCDALEVMNFDVDLIPQQLAPPVFRLIRTLADNGCMTVLGEFWGMFGMSFFEDWVGSNETAKMQAIANLDLDIAHTYYSDMTSEDEKDEFTRNVNEKIDALLGILGLAKDDVDNCFYGYVTETRGVEATKEMVAGQIDPWSDFGSVIIDAMSDIQNECQIAVSGVVAARKYSDIEAFCCELNALPESVRSTYPNTIKRLEEMANIYRTYYNPDMVGFQYLNDDNITLAGSLTLDALPTELSHLGDRQLEEHHQYVMDTGEQAQLLVDLDNPDCVDSFQSHFTCWLLLANLNILFSFDNREL